MEGFDTAFINQTVVNVSVNVYNRLNNSDINPEYGISETMATMGSSDPPDSLELLSTILLGCLGAAVVIILLFTVSYYFIWKHKKKAYEVEVHTSASYRSIPSHNATGTPDDICHESDIETTATKTAINLNNYKDEHVKSLDERKCDNRTDGSKTSECESVKIDLETKRSKPTHPNQRGVFPRIALSPPKKMPHKETDGKYTPKRDNPDQVVYQNEYYLKNDTETRSDSKAYEDDGYIIPLPDTDISTDDYYTVATGRESRSDSKGYEFEDDGYVPPLNENGISRSDYLTIPISSAIASEDIYANEGGDDYENVPDSCRK